MADETTAAIDRIFDFLDKGADAADRVLNRERRLVDDQAARRAKRGERGEDPHPRRTKREVINAQATPVPKKETAKTSSSTAVTRKPHFYIVESTDPKSGVTIFVVTDGGNARTECSTRAFANRILQALETSSGGTP